MKRGTKSRARSNGQAARKNDHEISQLKHIENEISLLVGCSVVIGLYTKPEFLNSIPEQTTSSR